jgi:predicted nucleic acid-binding protein
VLLLPAFDFATRYGVAVYDGAFLAGASMLAVDFITADEVLYQKVFAHLPWVRLLRDFRT